MRTQARFAPHPSQSCNEGHNQMTTAESLNALADRVEREEPSDDLDASVARAVLGANRYVLAYTTSLDSAVTLVLEGWNWSVERFTFDAGNWSYGRRT